MVREEGGSEGGKGQHGWQTMQDRDLDHAWGKTELQQKKGDVVVFKL